MLLIVVGSLGAGGLLRVPILVYSFVWSIHARKRDVRYRQLMSFGNNISARTNFGIMGGMRLGFRAAISNSIEPTM